MSDSRILGETRVELWDARKKIEEQQTEIERLRAALELIAAEAVTGQYDEWAGEIAQNALKERDDE